MYLFEKRSLEGVIFILEYGGRLCLFHHHHNLFLKRTLVSCSARVRCFSRYEAPTHILAHYPLSCRPNAHPYHPSHTLSKSSCPYTPTQTEWHRHGGIGGSGPPHLCVFRSHLRLNPLKSVYMYREGLPCMYIVTFYCSPTKDNSSDPPLFWAGKAMHFHWVSTNYISSTNTGIFC